MFDNIRADLQTYGGDWGAQGFWVMLVYRFGRWRYGVRPALLRKLFSLIYKVLFKFVQIITGIELPCEVVVGAISSSITSAASSSVAMLDLVMTVEFATA